MPDDNIRINVLFFSQLREIVGAGEMPVNLVTGWTVGDLLQQLYAQHPELQKWDRNILIGAGLEFVDRGYVIQPNDEIAIMPPVQGG